MKSIDQWFNAHNTKSDTECIRLVAKELKRVAQHIEWELHEDRVLLAMNLQDKDLVLAIYIVNTVYGHKVLYINADHNGKNERYDGMATPVRYIDDLKKYLDRTIDYFDIETTGIVRQTLFDTEDY